MDAMQVLAYWTAMGHRESAHAALPDAPVLPHRDRARVRVRLAHSLRRTADRLAPVVEC